MKKKMRRLIDTEGAPRKATRFESRALDVLLRESGTRCLCYEEVVIHAWLTGSGEDAPRCIFCQLGARVMEQPARQHGFVSVGPPARERRSGFVSVRPRRKRRRR